MQGLLNEGDLGRGGRGFTGGIRRRKELVEKEIMQELGVWLWVDWLRRGKKIDLQRDMIK